MDYASKGYTPEQIKAMQQAERKNPTSTLGLIFTRSFKDFPCYEFDYLTTLYSQFDKQGTLPFPGALSEQPAKIIEVFNTLKALLNEVEAKERKKQEKNNKRKTK